MAAKALESWLAASKPEQAGQQAGRYRELSPSISRTAADLAAAGQCAEAERAPEPDWTTGIAGRAFALTTSLT